jgi:hypothetical protein
VIGSPSVARAIEATGLPGSFRLDAPGDRRFSLLERFSNPAVETPPPATRFLFGPWGLERWSRLELTAPSSLPFAAGVPADPWLARRRDWAAAWAWRPDAGERSVADAAAWLPWTSQGPSRRPCSRRPVGFVRFGAEADRFSLLGCDGAVAFEAVDRLSVMLRPVGVARPELPLPDSPEQDAPDGEWVRSIKMVHPRLVWLVQQIADAFPGRTLYVVSGYRRGAHEGMHGKGRAIDLAVQGVSNERVYRACRRLLDVGCGFYPSHDFVHVDVRPPGTGQAYWVDVSEPGEPSRYVDSWPGIEERGAAAWLGGRAGAGR